MCEKKHAHKLRRIAEVETKRLSQEPDVVGTAICGSLASDTVWESSDLDLLVLVQTDEPLEYTIYSYSKDCGNLKIDYLHESTGKLTQLMNGYPESFIELPTLLLDAIYIMIPIYDETGFLQQVKEFWLENRFSALVKSGRAERGVDILKKSLSEAEELLNQGDHEGAWAQARNVARIIAELWLEYDGQVFSDKTQDIRLAELCSRLDKPHIYKQYSRILGIDRLSRRELEHMADDIAQIWELHCLLYEEFLGAVKEGRIRQENVSLPREAPMLGDQSDAVRREPFDPCDWALLGLAWARDFGKQPTIAYSKGCYGFLVHTWIVMPGMSPKDTLGILKEAGAQGLGALEDIIIQIETLAPHIEEHREYGQASMEDVQQILETVRTLVSETESHLLNQ